MRLFIAIPLTDEIRGSLAEYQGSLRTSGVTGNYSPPENLYVTLAFIGEYGDPSDVCDALRAVSFEPFGLEVRETGSFSDTLWAGIASSGALEKLAKDIRRALADAGIPFDRKKFRPHITLIRRAHIPGRMPGMPALPFSSMTVASFSLFRSNRGKHGMIYTELETFSFSAL